MYKYLAKAWASPEESYVKELMKERVVGWRRGRSVVRVERPTRLNRARALGYKAKQGVVVVRVRVRKGGLRKSRPRAGRRPKRMGVAKHTPAISIQRIAEERAAKRYPNMKALGSYWVWEDGQYKWYEVILVDPYHPAVKSDPNLSWVCRR